MISYRLVEVDVRGGRHERPMTYGSVEDAQAQAERLMLGTRPPRQPREVLIVVLPTMRTVARVDLASIKIREQSAELARNSSGRLL